MIPTYLASLLSLLTYSLPISALAQSPTRLVDPQLGPIQTAVKFSPPPDTERPEGETASSRRGGCFEKNKKDLPLTGVVPPKKIGLTVAAHPTFFLYVPQTKDQAVEFILQDENDREIYKTNFRMNDNAGIISISLPDTANLPPLEVGKNYRWYFSLICDVESSDGNIFIDGWVRRVEPSLALKNQLEKAAPRDRADIYAAAGIWQETLASLAELRRSRPNDSALASEWANLLRSVGLNEIAEEPLAPL